MKTLSSSEELEAVADKRAKLGTCNMSAEYSILRYMRQAIILLLSFNEQFYFGEYLSMV